MFRTSSSGFLAAFPRVFSHAHQLRTATSVIGCHLYFTGCASIISGRHADVAFDSNPAGAHVAVRDDEGREVAALTTPGVAKLRRNRKYFMRAKYTATI